METTSPRRTIREYRQLRTGVILIGIAVVLGVVRVVTSDTTMNSLLFVPVFCTIFGGALIMRALRHI